MSPVTASVPAIRLLAVTIFGAALTLVSNTLEPAVLGHKVLTLAPDSPNTALGLSTAAGLIVAMLVQPVVGALSDRTRSPLGRRLPYFILGTVIVILCLYLIALAPVFGVVVLGLLLIQLGSNIVQGPWQALIPDHIPPHLHGRAAGVKGTVDILAVVLGRASAGALVGQHPEWGLLAILAAVTVPVVVYLAALAITWVWAGEPAHVVEQHATADPLDQAIRRSFHINWGQHPAFGWWFANRLLFWAGLLILNTFLLTFVVQAVGLEQADAQRYVGTLSVVLGVGVVLITLPAGWLTDRIGRVPVVASAGAVAAVGTLGLLLSRDLNLLLVFAAIIGLGSGAFISASWALVTDIVPLAEAARYLGIANIATTAGSLLGRTLGALIIDPINQVAGNTTAGYIVVYGLAALFFFLSALTVLRLPAYK